MRRLALLPALILAAVLLGGAADDSGGSAGRPGHYGYMDGRDLPAATRELAWALIHAGGAEPAPIGRNPRVMAAVEAITRAAEDGDAAAAQVLDLLRATKLAEAATALAAIATAHPSAQAERTLAVIAGLTSMRRATYAYARAAELDPSDAESRFCVADAARRAGRIDDAVAGFRAVLALTEGDEASRARFWSLTFLARIDHERGNAVMALEGYAAARELAEHLAAAQPFNAEYQHNLLVVLDWTGYALMDRRRMAEAEAVFLDARGIAERMAASNRSARDWQAYAADSLMSLAVLHGRQNDMAGALALRRSALEIRARIAHDAPDGPEWQTALAATQARVGATILAAHAPVDEALAVLQAGLAIRTQQAEAAPDDAEAQRALLRDLASAGHALLRRTALADAQDMFSRAITVAKALHEAAPDTAEWTRALARAHENAGDAFVQQNADAPAAASFGAARTLWRGLDPAAQDDEVQWALVDVCSKLGEAQARRHVWHAALEAYLDEFEAASTLATAQPADVPGQQALALAYLHLGQAWAKRHNHANAWSAFENSLSISARLSVAAPQDSGRLWTLADARMRYGDERAADAQLGAALDLFRAAGDDYARLSQMQPGNPQWQRWLASVVWREGDALRRQQDIAAAQAVFRRCAALRDALAAANPGDTQDQVNAVWAQWKLADLGDDAPRRWAVVVTRLRALDAAGQLKPGDRKWLREAAAHVQAVRRDE